MTTVDAVAQDFIEAILRYAKSHPEVVSELRELLGPAAAPARERDVEPEFMTVAAFAARVRLSKRTVENLIREGLPLVGRGRRRRVPVREAVEWLRAGGACAEVEERARRDARRASARAASRRVEDSGK